MRHHLILFSSLVLAFPSAGKDDVLLITSPELKESWQPFADWKKKNGKSVRIVTTSEIDKKFKGPDIQEKIRLCVRQSIDENKTRWIILGGDSQPGGKGIVPDRDTVHQNMWGKNTDIPTDIYYLSPTNWDADNDGIYGEFKDDQEAITYPDGTVGLGRIPVRTIDDVKAYTDKVISYESKYPAGDFKNTFTYTCTVPGAYPKVRRSWDDHVSKALAPHGGGKMSRYFAHKTPWDKDKPGDHQLSPANWIEMINARTTGKFHFHGHGLHHCWVLEDHEMFHQKKHVQKAHQQRRLPPLSPPSPASRATTMPKKDPCISESMLRIPKRRSHRHRRPLPGGKNPTS